MFLYPLTNHILIVCENASSELRQSKRVYHFVLRFVINGLISRNDSANKKSLVRKHRKIIYLPNCVATHAQKSEVQEEKKKKSLFDSFANFVLT